MSLVWNIFSISTFSISFYSAILEGKNWFQRFSRYYLPPKRDLALSKTFKRHYRCLLNVVCTFSLYPVPRGYLHVNYLVYLYINIYLFFTHSRTSKTDFRTLTGSYDCRVSRPFLQKLQHLKFVNFLLPQKILNF